MVTYPSLTRVPGAPEYLLGVFAHRGEVIPVVDIALLTGGSAVATKRAVLVRAARGSVALTASQVAGVAALTGAMAPLGSSGVHLHLRGPAQGAAHDVAVIEPEGLLEFLSQGS